MPLVTTCIGAYPKPDFVKLPDWFNIADGPDSANPTRDWKHAMQQMGSAASSIIDKGVKQVIDDQLAAGIDIPTDGEIIRENYIHYHCRHLDGIDFDNLTLQDVRGGNYQAHLPTISGPIKSRGVFLVNDWRAAQAHCAKPVKITLPGPMTIGDTNADAFYSNPADRGRDIAIALNEEILALAAAGAKHIQIDEPLFARKPEAALEYGFDHLEQAFSNCPPEVTRTVHMCCGYPDRLDHPNYPKADRSAYLQLADAIESSSIDAVSIEDAHCHNDLSLLENFSSTSVIFGAVAIAQSRIETVDEIRQRLSDALDHIDAERLMVAPDCGLGLLSRQQAVAKLTNLCAAARTL